MSKPRVPDRTEGEGAAPRAAKRGARAARARPTAHAGQLQAAMLPPDWRLRQQIRIRHLSLLQALDRLGSLSKAADSLSVTQPAATKLLAQLEALLQLPLFERSARGMVATEYGAVMIRHAHAALGEISAARDALEQVALGAQGRVNIGAVVGSLPRLTATAITRLLARHPRLAISVTVETSTTLVPMLERGELDLVVGQMPGDADLDTLQFEPLMPEPVEVVVRRQHRLARARRVRLEQLLDEAWVLPPTGSALRERFDAMFHSGGLETPRRVVETASTLLATSLALGSDSLSVLSRDVALHYAANAGLSLLRLRLPEHHGTIGLLSRQRIRLTAATALLAEELRAVAWGPRRGARA
ncbi:MAG: LysR family transcriptional regulator [Burkholderiaceae bacterium]|nr:LysR family transcriptional regulator [Burkholderiaceae bacterium]